jgi:hypothetical protein
MLYINKLEVGFNHFILTLKPKFLDIKQQQQQNKLTRTREFRKKCKHKMRKIFVFLNSLYKLPILFFS